MSDPVFSSVTYADFLANSPPTQFEVQRPIKPITEARLQQGNIDLDEDGLAGLLQRSGVKPLSGKLCEFVQLLNGEHKDLNGIYNMTGCVVGDDVAVVREDKHADFAVAIRIGSAWLVVGHVDQGDPTLKAMIPDMVQTGSSPAERAIHARRTARLAEYDAGLRREADEKRKMREIAELQAEQERERDRAALAKRSGIR